MSRSLFDDVLSCPTLPSLPQVAVEVLELTGDPDVPMKKIAACVQRDQALAGKVLKTVNSSFYGLSKPCGSIDRAMSFLGLNTVKSLVLGFSLVDASKLAGAEGFDLMTHWRRAIVGAVSSRHVAVLTRAADPDEAFTAALFQDIGVLACFVSLKERYAEVVVGKFHADWAKAETEAFGFTHVEIGEALAKRWKLPVAIRAAVGAHHSPDGVEPAYADLARVVCLGAMVGSVLGNEAPVPSVKRISQSARAWFGDRAPNTEALIERASDDARVIAKLFHQDIGRLPDIQSLLAEAEDKGLEHQLEIQRRSDALAKEASTDPLTGLANRRRFELDLDDALQRFTRDGSPMAVIFCDADRFKAVNDTHGHAAGDAVLIELAHRIRDTVGNAGTVARYGGEEIAVVLPGLGINEAAILGERIRDAVASAPFDLTGVECEPDLLTVTVSVGVSATDAADPARCTAVLQLVGEADSCVYEAKRAGRDRVFVHRAVETTRMARPTAPAPQLGTVRVLFVEDDPLAATLITTLLKRQKGVEIQWIESGTRAANEIKRMDAGETPPVDIFLVDLNLPGTSGYELLKMVRASDTLRGLTFLVLSGEDEATSREECLRLGATEFIPKQEFVSDIGRWVELISGKSRTKAAA